MTKKLSVNFLWHMHQPYYRDDISGEIVMPWVFLHAIKDYYDMPWYLEKFPKIKATFNLVPSLLVQLGAYENPEVNDKFLKVLRKRVEELDSDEKAYLVEYLFFSNEHNMIKPFERYQELFLKKEDFSNSELIDLEVLFILAWCGNYLRENKTIVKNLIQKGRGFTQEEKIELLNELSGFIKEVIPYYKKLMDKGQIEISTTPFNHPISPLLFDIENGKLANHNTTLPKYDGDFKEYALMQIDSAVEYYEKLFGKKPTGWWPAEGSVSYDFLEVLETKGATWACSDQEVLYKSGYFVKEDIYKNNTLYFKDKSINLFFRDRELSDLIGFSYSGWDAKSAVADLIGRLRKIHVNSTTNSNVNIILDGENAWEHYPDNAKEFFELLYSELDDCNWIESRLFDEVIKDKKIAVNELHELQPGSWINGNFNIWIGHEEKNRAWEMLFQTKADFEKNEKHLDEEVIKTIKNEFLIAQSSDWFWWYGDDHHTDLGSTFDKLFRTHLMNIYTLMDKKIPENILEPIVETSSDNNDGFIKPAINRITAELDGKISHFYEWLGCGSMDLSKELSSMSMHDFAIEKIYYGCDNEHCYIALIGDLTNGIVEMEFSSGKKIKMPLSKSLNSHDGISFITDEIMEIQIDKKLVEKDTISFKLFNEGKLVQLLPLYSKIEFNCLKEIRKNWYI
ncbi:MAG TPA: glycoside hydrolase [Campylobacterales bacterium]|nr:glycoside hydrolase [Campylobacterales bacterium]